MTSSKAASWRRLVDPVRARSRTGPPGSRPSNPSQAERGAGRGAQTERPREGSRPSERPRHVGHVVPGERAVVELLEAAPSRIRSLLVTRESTSREVVALAERAGVRIQVTSREAIEDLVRGVRSGHVVALAEPPPSYEVSDLLADVLEGPQPRLLVAIDGVKDPRNLGAILRSCEFFGARGVFWAQDRVASLTPAAVLASAGASERLKMARPVNLARALAECREANVWVIGTVVDDGEPLEDVANRRYEPAAVVLGGEEDGLRRLTRASCDLLTTIRGAGRLGSLNVSAAAAVVLSALSKTDESRTSRRTGPV